MSKQRSAGAATRRAFLAGVGGAAASIAGCTGTVGPAAPRTDRAPVSILAAGSLGDALEHGLEPATSVPLQVEAHGSATAARMVAEGQKNPDIVSLADVSLFAAPLQSPWLAEFATNALVIAYDPDSAGGRRLAEAGPDRWYRPLLDGEVALGRTDPDVDPLGYRTLFMLELATDYYGTDANLRETVPAPAQRYPETQLVSQFETGSIDAAVTYRSMATERGYAYVDLPRRIDLSDPRFAERYATATYRLPGGQRVRGGVISYGATVRDGHRRDAVARVFGEHVTGDYLTDYGFTVPDDYPRYTGDVPDEIRR